MIGPPETETGRSERAPVFGLVISDPDPADLFSIAGGSVGSHRPADWTFRAGAPIDSVLG